MNPMCNNVKLLYVNNLDKEIKFYNDKHRMWSNLKGYMPVFFSVKNLPKKLFLVLKTPGYPDVVSVFTTLASKGYEYGKK